MSIKEQIEKAVTEMHAFRNTLTNQVMVIIQSEPETAIPTYQDWINWSLGTRTTIETPRQLELAIESLSGTIENTEKRIRRLYSAYSLPDGSSIDELELYEDDQFNYLKDHRHACITVRNLLSAATQNCPALQVKESDR